MYIKTPLILYSGVGNMLVLSAASQIFAVIFHRRHETQHAERFVVFGKLYGNTIKIDYFLGIIWQRYGNRIDYFITIKLRMLYF